jgi:amino acid adenylation domain-containing protein
MKEKLAMEIVNEVRSEQINGDQTSMGATIAHEKANNGRPSTENSRNMPGYTILTPLRKERNADKPLLSEREQQQIAAWNATQQSYLQDTCVHQLVEKQAAKFPEAVALWTANQVMTYEQLNQRANQLAHYLQTLGIGPNVLVGLCVERSLNMVVGMLSILKAGGTYVPLDPAYPAERLNYMLKDAQITVLLTQKHLTVRLAEQNITCICMDADMSLLAQQSITNPAPTATAADLVYVIYTSGSTGQPKGVEITHKSLLNLVFWHQRTFEVTSSDRVTQVTSPAFDATGWEVWPYLASGASIYFPDEETRVTPTSLQKWFAEHQVTISFLPTALAESMIALEWPSTTSLRFLLTGADTLHRYPSSTLPFAFINNYGPTEATVVTTSGCVYPVAHAYVPPSIGRPIDNMQVYILNEHLQQVPIGTVGELYIGGDGLARGYLNRPELTDERFIHHPFSKDPNARLYKTGDLAHYLSDGQIAFLGRADYQIKIRGYRIEPNEIVAVLNRHPAVHMSVVIAREDIPGDKRLVAYIVPVPGASITSGSLRSMLKNQLPTHMIPSTFVLLEVLPITLNGKVDRAALPAPDAANTLTDSTIAVPTNPIEKQLTDIVLAILKLDQVGIDENFFMIGGHSLLGTQLIALVDTTFGVKLTLRGLFNAPTIRLLAAEVERLILAKIESMSEAEVQQLLGQG